MLCMAYTLKILPLLEGKRKNSNWLQILRLAVEHLFLLKKVRFA